MTLSRTTKDHDEIRKWAESHGAVPAEVAHTERGGEPGILRFEFPHAPNRNDSKLKEISWNEFFDKFDENDLELVYQEKTADGQKSNFNKLVHPSSEEHSSRHGSESRSHSASRSNKSESHKSEAHSTGTKSHSSGAGTSHNANGSRAQARKAGDMADLNETDESNQDSDNEALHAVGASHSASTRSHSSGPKTGSTGRSK